MLPPTSTAGRSVFSGMIIGCVYDYDWSALTRDTHLLATCNAFLLSRHYIGRPEEPCLKLKMIHLGNIRYQQRLIGSLPILLFLNYDSESHPHLILAPSQIMHCYKICKCLNSPLLKLNNLFQGSRAEPAYQDGTGFFRSLSDPPIHHSHQD